MEAAILELHLNFQPCPAVSKALERIIDTQ